MTEPTWTLKAPRQPVERPLHIVGANAAGDHAMNVDEYADQLAVEWGME